MSNHELEINHFIELDDRARATRNNQLLEPIQNFILALLNENLPIP